MSYNSQKNCSFWHLMPICLLFGCTSNQLLQQWPVRLPLRKLYNSARPTFHSSVILRLIFGHCKSQTSVYILFVVLKKVTLFIYSAELLVCASLMQTQIGNIMSAFFRIRKQMSWQMKKLKRVGGSVCMGNFERIRALKDRHTIA